MIRLGEGIGKPGYGAGAAMRPSAAALWVPTPVIVAPSSVTGGVTWHTGTRSCSSQDRPSRARKNAEATRITRVLSVMCHSDLRTVCLFWLGFTETLYRLVVKASYWLVAATR
jgi:hypothetical protein